MARRMRRRKYKRRRIGRRRRVNKATKRFVANKLSRAIETKGLEAFSNSLTISSSGQRQLLFNLPEGTDDDERIGDQVTPKYMRLQGTVSFVPSFNVAQAGGFMTTTLTEPTVKVRCIIIRATRYINPSDSATWPTMDDVWPGWSSTGFIDAPYLMTARHKKDFIVLKDKLFAGNFFQSWSQQYAWKFKGKKLGGKVTYNAAGWYKNCVFVYLYADSNAVPHPSWWVRVRYLYKDA